MYRYMYINTNIDKDIDSTMDINSGMDENIIEIDIDMGTDAYVGTKIMINVGMETQNLSRYS